jgi:hypothetical protein
MGRVFFAGYISVQQMTSLHHWQAAYGPLHTPFHRYNNFPNVPKRPETMTAFTLILTRLLLTTGILSSVG